MLEIKEPESIKHRHPKKKKKIRSLVITDQVEAKSNSRLKFKKCGLIILFVIFTVFISSLILFDYGDLQKRFQGNYEKKYHSIIQGNENFCDEKLNGNLVDNFTQFVTSQDEVISSLKRLFSSNKPFISVGFTGAHGTGKTLVGNLLIQHWFWPDNIQKILWTFIFQDFRSLSYCGYNLIVIDDIPLSSENFQLAGNIKNHLEKLTQSENYKIVLILIFNGNPQNQEVLSPPDLEVLQFNSMDLQLVRKCIQLTAKNMNITIKDNEDMNEFLKDINYQDSGCKNVQRKLVILLDDKKIDE